jgi:DNA polymerase-1
MLIQCDASQLEWRTALELSKEWVGINEILEGEDTHAKNQKAFGLPSRLIAKIFLFRTIFRGSGWSFANDPDFMHVSTSPAFWDSLNEKFYAKYSNLDKTHHRWKDMVMSGKPIVGPLGREWSINIGRDYKGELKVPWTTLSNYPIQGTGADVMMLARLSANRRIKEAGIEARLISTVHDSIVWDTTEKYLEPIRDICDGVFRDIPANIKKLFNYDWETPMACESKYGPNMKDMKKFQ